jgi:hypothetical protein
MEGCGIGNDIANYCKYYQIPSAFKLPQGYEMAQHPAQVEYADNNPGPITCSIFCIRLENKPN